MTEIAINHLRASLEENLTHLLMLMPREFVSNDFISAFKEIDPLTNAYVLRNCNSFREYHNWISKRYLNELANRGLIQNLKEKEDCTTWGGHDTNNTVWRILSK